MIQSFSIQSNTLNEQQNSQLAQFTGQMKCDIFWESESNRKISDDEWYDAWNSSNIHQFTDMEGVLLEKLDSVFYHAQIKKQTQ